MKLENVDVSLVIKVPTDKPNANGVCYTSEAVRGAIEQMSEYLPLIIDSNMGQKIIGCTVCRPYAIQTVQTNDGVQFTVDGKITSVFLEHVIKKRDVQGNVADFGIVSIGIEDKLPDCIASRLTMRNCL